MARDRSAAGVLVAAGRPAARPAPTFQQRARPQQWLGRHWLDLLMVAPLVLYILFFMLVPVAQSIYLSFMPRDGGARRSRTTQPSSSRSQFQAAFVNTIGITVIGVTMEMMVGLTMALMLARKFRGRGLFRTIMLTRWACRRWSPARRCSTSSASTAT